jgi:mannose-6-phosphate isomerase-like protein (cupin superfamily)
MLAMQKPRMLGVAMLSFALGMAASRMPGIVHAAPAPLAPTALDLAAVTPDSMPTPTTIFPNLRSKPLFATDAMTAVLSVGTAPKHIHNGSNEVQIVLEGTGSEWLGDRQITLKPEMIVVIPSGTEHGGLIETSGHLKFVAIKTPPQDPADIHFLP